MPKSSQTSESIAVVGVDLGKNTFHAIGFDKRGKIIFRRKFSRRALVTWFANLPACLVGMKTCVGSHHLARRLQVHGHDARLTPAKYVKPFLKGHKNDFRDAEAIAEAVQRPTMRFVAIKTTDQLDLQALHRIRERLVSHRTGVINQFRAFLLERGVAVRQGLRFLHAELPEILAKREDVHWGHKLATTVDVPVQSAFSRCGRQFGAASLRTSGANVALESLGLAVQLWLSAKSDRII